MPLSKARMKERKRADRLHVKPKSNLDTIQSVKPNGADVKPKLHQQLEKQGLVMAGNKIVGVSKAVRQEVALVQPEVLPRYNAAVHKAGDRVLVLKGKRWVEAVIPELDAGGQPYY